MNRPDDYDLYLEEGMRAEEERHYEEMLHLEEMAKRKEPCKWRYKGICRHGGSKWYNDRVTGDKKERCNNCSRYEK